MKKTPEQVAEMATKFAKRLSDNELYELNDKLNCRYGGDLAESCKFFQRFADVDYYLRSLGSGDEWYDSIELFHKHVAAEFSSRSGSHARD